jgi:hypothetical protein
LPDKINQNVGEILTTTKDLAAGVLVFFETQGAPPDGRAGRIQPARIAAVDRALANAKT